MKKNYILVILYMFLALTTNVFGQYSIGHESPTYTDASRSNRSITTDIYYPATSTGSSTPFAAGAFPVIVFGHGFDMGDDAYVYIEDSLVPLGYIVVFPTTESGLSPSHSDFGMDMAFLINQMKTEGANSSSFFYNHVSAQSAVMGHSMGGGAAFLACANNTVPTCMITFAAAETTPSAIAAADSITIPALVLSGSADCVAAPATNQVPMYDSLASTCKIFLSITNGCHCYFGDYNLACTFGESTCDAVPPLSRAAQHQTILDFIKPYLAFYLKGNATSWTDFTDSLSISDTSRFTYQESCTITNIKENASSVDLSIYPNPSSNSITLYYSSTGKYTINVVDILGKQVLPEIIGYNMSGASRRLDISSLTKGMYFVELNINGQKFYKKILKE
jgi:pimeloyl-ACP methyl ester carboxylesterase